MNKITKAVVSALIPAVLGFAACFVFLSDNYVKMENTKAGIFIITQGQIYTVSALITDDSTAYKMKVTK